MHLSIYMIEYNTIRKVHTRISCASAKWLCICAKKQTQARKRENEKAQQKTTREIHSDKECIDSASEAAVLWRIGIGENIYISYETKQCDAEHCTRTIPFKAI